MKTLVSIIIPTYNRASFLGETLDSVLQQTYTDWECIVVDDGSVDYTPELMEFYCQKNSGIKYFRRPEELSKGANACRNYGFELSRGAYVMWLDDDDLMQQEKLEKQVKACADLENGLSTCAWGRLTTQNTFHPKELKIYKDYDDPVNLLADYGSYGFFPSHAFLLPRALAVKAGPWREDLGINQDAEFFSRVIVQSNSIKFAKGTFVKYREHNHNKTSIVNNTSKGIDLLRSWSLIEENIPKKRSHEIKKYIGNGRKHAYNLLKQAGLKHVIFLNFYYFRRYIARDIRKKMIR